MSRFRFFAGATADGKAVPTIVVMPNGGAQPNDRAEGNVMATAPAFANDHGNSP